MLLLRLLWTGWEILPNELSKSPQNQKQTALKADTSCANQTGHIICYRQKNQKKLDKVLAKMFKSFPRRPERSRCD